MDPFGHAYYPGPADMLCQELLQRGIRARYDKPGTLQRMAGALVSPVDREEAARCGAAAVEAAAAGVTDCMVALERAPGPAYHCDTRLVPLSAIANTERLLPDEFINAAGNNITDAFLAYAAPLIGGPLPAYFQVDALGPHRLGDPANSTRSKETRDGDPRQSASSARAPWAMASRRSARRRATR